ncbi:MAG: D-TA family PLP-dependent enzyme, partial [Planctomycetota bacterium]
MPPKAFIEPAALAEISSPALIFFHERIEANMAAMLALVGGDPSRLRPHVKTHKCGAIIRRW